MLSRLLYAGRGSASPAPLALVIAAVIGIMAGLISGYYGGWFDSVSSWIASLIMALPGIVVLLAARAVLGPSLWTSMVDLRRHPLAGLLPAGVRLGTRGQQRTVCRCRPGLGAT